MVRVKPTFNITCVYNGSINVQQHKPDILVSVINLWLNNVSLILVLPHNKTCGIKVMRNCAEELGVPPTVYSEGPVGLFCVRLVFLKRLKCNS